jgi:hypothetical protein
MTPKQLRRLLEEAGLTQCGAARLIEISPRQMRYYIAGKPIPKHIEYALLWVAWGRAL